jgi:adenylate cyclase
MPIIITIGYGLFSLGITQIIILSRLFAKSYKRVENYAKDLKIEVEEKTKDLRKEKEISEKERDKSEKLLLNVLPESIASRLKQGETPIADHFKEASVIFIDIADFTKLSAKSSPQMMVKMLNEIFTIFDKIAAKYGLEKIKTIGDCYMAAAGIPVPRNDHAEAIAMMALDVMSKMKEYRSEDGHEIKFRIGLDCGPIVAGVIGEQKFIYDLWGDMVNTASRMETNGVIGRIQCTERFKNKLTIDNLQLTNEENRTSKIEHRTTIFEERGEIEIKGKGKMRTWFLINN